MAYKYFQTDDRDDYFASLKTNNKKKCTLTLISPTGETLLKSVPMYKVRTYAKKNYVSEGNAKFIWRKLLTDKGYQIINNPVI